MQNTAVLSEVQKEGIVAVLSVVRDTELDEIECNLNKSLIRCNCSVSLRPVAHRERASHPF